jgi:HSP90 family molecular chaperone
MMQMVDQANVGRASELPPQVMEINPKHPIIIAMAEAQESGNTEVLEIVAAQLLDNSLVAAGLMDDARTMLPRMNDLMEAALKRK